RPKRMSPNFTQAYKPLDSSINPLDFTISYRSD
ncbi:acyl-CoA thioesterase, partial [Acinetobacter baumannii]